MNLTNVFIKEIQNNKYKVASFSAVFDDFLMIRGEICKKKDGGFFLSIANAPWKTDKGEWKNNYQAIIIADNAKAKFENYIISMYTSKNFTYTDPNHNANLTAYNNKFKKASAPAQAPAAGLSF